MKLQDLEGFLNHLNEDPDGWGYMLDVVLKSGQVLRNIAPPGSPVWRPVWDWR